MGEQTARQRASAKYRETHREELRRKRIEHYARNAPIIREKQRAWNKLNRLKKREAQREYCLRHPEKIKERDRLYMEKYPEKKAASNRQWYFNNTEKRRLQESSPEIRIKKLVQSAIHRAKTNNKEFDSEFLYSLTRIARESCACCGCPINYERIWGAGRVHEGPSLDRVDNNYGYVRGNIQITCNRCNTLKSDMTLERVEQIATYIRRYTPAGPTSATVH